LGGEKTLMDFTNRGGNAPIANQPLNTPSNNMPTFPNNSVGNNRPHSKKTKAPFNFMKWGTFGIGAIIVLLVIAIVMTVILINPKSQASYVYTNKLQAVFLNTGQVYFGNIESINAQYLVLDNIFYLQSNSGSSASSSTSNNSNVSLVKLGCELHAPYDQMVINMQQVTFWENLQSTGQVAKAVAQYEKTYPHGQVCSNTSSSSSASPSSLPSTPTTPAKP
jgi:hypothetical protein